MIRALSKLSNGQQPFTISTQLAVPPSAVAGKTNRL